MNRVKDHAIIEQVLTRIATLHECDWRDIVNFKSYGRRTARHRETLYCIYVLSCFIERDSVAEAFNKSENTIKQYASQGRTLFANSHTFKSICTKIKSDIVKQYYA